MNIRPYRPSDQQAVIALWQRTGLTRPWNDPATDIDLCIRTPASEIFVGEQSVPTKLVSTVMVGSDGHRGWLYYLAVDPDLGRGGLGREMVAHAESWLKSLGVRKAELLIREENVAVQTFYERIGYAVEPRTLMTRWLTD